ncbi:hypothetical protein [Pacificibacter marinus]|uniref:hypothetical protein n=1 Tax=Pacificibacter marinus TaxID=658057 RepID=UPI00209074ED|nr:hypothetical protein [Pacificibacter marinus]
MSTGPQTQLNPRIRQSMDQMLEAQLDSLQSQLESSNGALRKTAQSAARTISNDLEGLKSFSRDTTQQLKAEVELRKTKIETLNRELEQQRQRHSKIVTKRMVVLVLFGVTLAGVTTAATAFLGAKTATTRPPEPSTQLIPEQLTGSRITRGVGGLGQVIVMPLGLVPARCPIGTGTNRTCLKME